MTTHDHDLSKRPEAAGMNGKELLQAMIDGRLPGPAIGKTLSFRLVEVGDGFAVFEGEPGPHVLSPTGTVHGGWALTLIDSATGCAAHTLLPAGSRYATVETKGNLTPNHSRHWPRPRRRPRRVPGPPNHFRRSQTALAGWPHPGARYFDHHGAVP